MQQIVRADSLLFDKTGNTIAARIAMIEMTTSNSINVNARTPTFLRKANDMERSVCMIQLRHHEIHHLRRCQNTTPNGLKNKANKLLIWRQGRDLKIEKGLCLKMLTFQIFSLTPSL